VCIDGVLTLRCTDNWACLSSAKVSKSESNESFVTKLRNVKSTLNDVSDQIDAVVGVVERFQG